MSRPLFSEDELKASPEPGLSPVVVNGSGRPAVPASGDDEYDDALAASEAYADAVEYELKTGEPMFRPKPRPRGLVRGGSFLYDIPDGTPSLWGDGKHVVWAEGEALMLTGPQGAGKTSDAGQLAFGLAGVPGFETLYGLPVRPLPEGKTVLYLALDRPAQIARAHRRLIAPEHRALLDARLVYNAGRELPFTPTRMLNAPELLAAWAEECFAGAVIVDSLKDAIGELSNEEVASQWNAVVQSCLDRGIEVALLHHMRKAHAQNRRPRTLDDVHGSGNITRGLGSVVLVWGLPGAEEVEFVHLKQPAEPVGPFVISRDHDSGRSTVLRDGVLPQGARADRDRALRAYFTRKGADVPVTLDELRAAGLGSDTRLRETLSALVSECVLAYVEGGGRGNASTWRMLPLDAQARGREERGDDLFR